MRIRSHLKSFPRYKFVLLDTYHPNILYLREQGCEDPWLFFEAKRGPRAKKFGKHWFTHLASEICAISSQMLTVKDYCAGRES